MIFFHVIVIFIVCRFNNIVLEARQGEANGRVRVDWPIHSFQYLISVTSRERGVTYFLLFLQLISPAGFRGPSWCVPERSWRTLLLGPCCPPVLHAEFFS